MNHAFLALELHPSDNVAIARNAIAKDAAQLALILRRASGEPSKSEELGVGNEEPVPWMIGAQM